MFSFNLFRVKTFNHKFVLNTIKINEIRPRFMCDWVNTPQRTDQTFGTSSAIRDNVGQVRQERRMTQTKDRLQKWMLEDIFALSHYVAKGVKRIDELVDENEFKTMCDSIERNITDLTNKELIRCLHSFLVMGLDPECRVVRISVMFVNVS